MVGIIVTSSATKLSSDGGILQSTELFFQTIHKNHHLLTQTCGRGRLSVGLGKHRNVLPLLSIVVELFDEFLDHWIVYLLQSLLDAQGNTGIVDIL